MAKLIYVSMASLDGYVEDEQGKFDWGVPDDELHADVNELVRPIGAYLYGRRIYETMAVWETYGRGAEDPSVVQEFGELWRATEKIVYSRTLQGVFTPRTRVEHDFDPEAIQRLKADSPRDLTVGGAELAGVALAAGLVDEVHLYLHPIALGGGKPALPRGVRLPLELLSERCVSGRVAHLHYAVRS